MKRFAAVFVPLLLAASCAGPQIMEQRDSLGRVVRVTEYSHGVVSRAESIHYYRNSYNPATIIYYSPRKGVIVPDREEIYTFHNNDVARIDFFTRRGTGKRQTGAIAYGYGPHGPVKIVYQRFAQAIQEFYLTALDIWEYREGSVANRRLIEYELNDATGNSMQTSQHAIHYIRGVPIELKSWTMDKISKKIIEKIVHNPDEVKSLTAALEARFYLAVQKP